MLSGNINIEDGDWDSVRQGYAALTRDLERIYLSYGLGGNDFGGGTPKNANDQTVMQDGNYGYNAVTTDMLDALEARFNAEIDAIPSVAYPISIANGGTGSTTAISGLRALGSFAYSTTIYSSSGGYTVPAGVSRMRFILIGGGGGGVDGDDTRVFTSGVDYVDIPTVGGAGGGGEIGIFEVDVVAGESYTLTCGAGGGRSSTTASAGGFTSIVFASDSLTIKAFGGSGGTYERGGAGGYGATGYVTNPRANTTYYTMIGHNGSTGGLGGGSFSASIGGSGVAQGGVDYGAGGNGAYPYGLGSGGTAGCAIVFY